MIDTWVCEDLIRHLCGADADDDDVDMDDLVDERFGITAEEFAKVIDAVLPLVAVGKSPISGQAYRGFALVDADGSGRWLLKRRAPDLEPGSPGEASMDGASA